MKIDYKISKDKKIIDVTATFKLYFTEDIFAPCTDCFFRKFT